MPRKLALFPLQIVVFPGEEVNLHIFEPRYRQLIRDCRDEGITFGIPAYQDNRIREFGTEVKLTEIYKTYGGGEMDVRTVARGVFRIQEFFPTLDDKLYAGGLVRDYAHDAEENLELNEQILGYARKLFAAMNIKRELPENAYNFTTYDVAHFVGFNPEEEYEFLTTMSAAARQQMLIEQIEKVLPVVREMENMRARARMNGHFKDLIPPNFLG